MENLIPGQEIANEIASSTSGYMVNFSPIFLLIGGLILGIVVITLLLALLDRRFPRGEVDAMDFDDSIES